MGDGPDTPDVNDITLPGEGEAMALFERLRNDDYTGAERCWPCTLVNLAAVGVLALLLRVRGRSLAGAAVATIGVAVVYLRGYLFPATPRFAPQLVAVSPLPDGWFADEGSPAETGSLASGVELDGATVLGGLSDAGVVRADAESLCLADDYEAAWTRRMDALADRPLADLAAELRRSFPHIDRAEPYTEDGKEWIAVGSSPGRLVARPVAVAELAAYQILVDATDDERLSVAGAEGFRTFLDSCPVCDSDLVESTTVSCCGGHTGPRQTPEETLVCPTCEQRLLTVPSADGGST